MVVPEFRWPTTPATLASTSFCATVVPTFGSAWSSARRAPFSLSLPRCAMPPVSGATWPILISIDGGGGGTSALASCLGAGFFSSPQPITPKATARTVNAIFDFSMDSPGRNGASMIPQDEKRDGLPAPFSSVRFSALLDRQDPFHERLDIGVGHRRVRGHRHLAPDALSALLHLLDELRLGVLLAGVLLRHIRVHRANGLGALDHVASGAQVLLRQLFVGLRGQRHAQGQHRGGKDQ